MTKTALLCALTWMLTLPAGVTWADEETGEEAQAAFFAGLDLKEAGDCEGAVARFQLSLSRDPELHQARLLMAECYQQLGLDAEAVAELTLYLQATFPGQETERAAALMTECGGDPDAVVVPVDDAGEGEPDDGGVGGDGDEPSGAPPAGGWSAVRLETGLLFEHYTNRIGLAAVGPVFDLRVLPMRYLELGLGASVGFGGYEDHEGAVQVPQFAASAVASIPIRELRMSAGVVVPLVVSRYDDASRVDPGVLGEIGLRIAVPGTPLVVGALVRGGFQVVPVIGGGLRVGFQLGPMGGGR